jgi:Protein of unknown function, DUF547
MRPSFVEDSRMFSCSKLSRRQAAGVLVAAVLAMPNAYAQSFDQQHAAWDVLLKKHVRWLRDDKQSRVDYKGFAADRAALKSILSDYSAVTAAQFAGFSRPQQMAFLINAYNAFTVELILTAYPKLKSIKDLGNVLQSPWKKRFFTLLGEERHLDWIEHEQLRPRYADWRIHMAVNCASIGCPALRDEAFTAAKLDAQLEDGVDRFMADVSRNRIEEGEAKISSIFKWFKGDFEKGHRGVSSVEDLLAKYTLDPSIRAAAKAKTLKISYLDYDWSLNDVGR